jgi:hypothetical protein
MKSKTRAYATQSNHTAAAPGRLMRTTLALIVLLLACAPALARQAARKLPGPEKIVGEYLKASGGKKRWAAVRDVVYEWTVNSAGVEARERVLLKAPGSARTERHTQGGEHSATSNPRMAWRGGSDAPVETLTGGEAHAAKLRALLDAGHLVDFKKMKVLARTAGVEEVGGEPAYVVEFSTREGARARFWFGVRSKLLLKTADAAGAVAHVYKDYRPAEGGVLVPHRFVRELKGQVESSYILTGVRFNTGLADTLFEPPADASLDIPALLRDLSRNQEEVDQRVNDYTFTRKVTQREVSDRGEVKKEKVSVYEVYPVQGWGWVMKLVSENGQPLAPERAAKEEKRVAEELLKAEREGPKRIREANEKRERERQKRAAKRRKKVGAEGAAAAEENEADVDIATFLRASEFVSPRRENFRGRETVVFDFRPRPGFRPSNRGESIASKLSGVVWVDPVERQVVRLEARLVESFKIAGGLMASIKPGSAFAFEQTRLADGVWLPLSMQVNASARVLIFAGFSVNQSEEFSDYKRFDAKTDDGHLNAPKETSQP